MEIISAQDYVTCVETGNKPSLAMVGPLLVTDGVVTESGKYILVVDGAPYEVKPRFRIKVEWEIPKDGGDLLFSGLTA